MDPQNNDCSNRIPFTLALITTCGFFSCLFFLLFYGYPAENKETITALLGSLGTIWILQMQFFFGSSASNKQKDQTIAQIATTPAPTPLAAPVAPKSPINIPNAESVIVSTKEGDVNLSNTEPKDKNNEKPVQ